MNSDSSSHTLVLGNADVISLSLMDNTSEISAPSANSLISFTLFPVPYPLYVLKGAIVIPRKSFSLRKDLTTGGRHYPKPGNPKIQYHNFGYLS